MNKQQYKEFGKIGAQKRWAPRYEIIKELTKYFAKDYQDKFLSWPTEYLKDLLKWVENYKNGQNKI